MERGTALVTGASSGIGAACCAHLRAQGWRVAGLARRPSPGADLSLQADVASFDEVREAVDALPGLRLLVHAAAVIAPVTTLAASDAQAWRRNVEVNLLGTYNVLRAVLAGPFTHGGGIAIHLTSGAAAAVKPHWSAYSASKAGAEHLIRSAASEVAGGRVAVCALDPGLTETPMQEQLRRIDFPDRNRFAAAHERSDGRTPAEIAAAVWVLAQRDPAALNGRTFRVGRL